MNYRFFHIPVLYPDPAAADLNRFLAQRRILSVDRHLVPDGQNSFWALAVTYLDAASGPDAASGRKAKVDYREVLDAPDFAIYAALRTLRKDLAEREGVPAYAVFTNEQLAAMVQGKAHTAADLAGIAGVGQARVEKYAAAFLRVLGDTTAAAESAERADAPDAN